MLVDTPAATLSTRYRWLHVHSVQPFAAVLRPSGGGRPEITTNDHCVIADDLPAVERWADACLGRGEAIAFLTVSALAAL